MMTDMPSANVLFASGQMNGTGKDFVQLNFTDIQCSDEGIYECVYVGYNANGELLKSTMKGELIVYCEAQFYFKCNSLNIIA